MTIDSREADHALVNEARRHFANCRSVCAFIDTIRLLLRVWLTSAQYRKLRSLNPGSIKYGKSLHWTHTCGVTLQRPSWPAIQFLLEIAPDSIFTRVDLSFDFLVLKQEYANELQEFLTSRLNQKWRGNRETKQHGSSFYFAKAGPGRNMDVYSSRPSKVTGTPTTHLELRFSGAQICENQGLSSLEDICSADPLKVLDRNCRLAFIDWPYIDSVLNAEAEKITRRSRDVQMPPIHKARLQSVIARSCHQGDDLPTWVDLQGMPTQHCLDCAPYLKPNPRTAYISLLHIIKALETTFIGPDLMSRSLIKKIKRDPSSLSYIVEQNR